MARYAGITTGKHVHTVRYTQALAPNYPASWHDSFGFAATGKDMADADAKLLRQYGASNVRIYEH